MQTRTKKTHSLMIDIDEVLAEHIASFRPYAARALGVDVEDLHDSPDWDFKAWFGNSGIDWRDVHDAAIRDGMLLVMDPRPGAAETVQELYQHYKILICTSRTPDPVSVSDTVDWLNTHQIYYDDLLFASDKSLVDVSWRIDDSLHQIEAFASKGQKFVIWDAPYNQVATGPRVRSWDDVAKIFIPSSLMVVG
jgi:5'(3')-deoxyribonucleotidase